MIPPQKKNDTIPAKVPISLVQDITEYATTKYGQKVKFTEAARVYAADHKRLRQLLNSKGGNNFL